MASWVDQSVDAISKSFAGGNQSTQRTLNSFGNMSVMSPRSAFNSTTNNNGFGQFSYDSAFTRGFGNDPIALMQSWADIQNAEFGAGAAGSYGGSVGQTAPTGDLSDDAVGFINATAEKYGIPANFLRAMLHHESSGDWRANNRVESGYRNQRMLPYVGIFESTAASYGINFNSLINNQGAQIDAMGFLLSEYFKKVGGEYGWQGVASYYYSGNPVAGGWTDEIGKVSSQQYVNNVMASWQSFDSKTGQSTYGSGFSAGDDAILSTFGSGASIESWGEYGIVADDKDMYQYGRIYGTNGLIHTGLDVAASVGTPFYAPFSSRVICAGTGNGVEACDAFNDYFGQGNGRIEIEVTSGPYAGARLIFGHSSTSSVRAGSVIAAGTMLGTSGGQNSAHIHIEARVRDSSTSSGWRIIDPRLVFSGSAGGAGGTGGTGAGGTTPGIPFWFNLPQSQGWQ